ncbi:CDGSH iron-sulfur domain-containing protein 2 homolog [Patiria miniata]|uniref:Iron-binding zinc finger CDGSH type domain-containing protein n=1 Tax=Patiria miniata TaxID=46514 RepID=A0A914A8S7_PATMI|nr:CDGSH iron-sulfur domain-containing protein 2 homolog [Patiria miniata]
MTICGKDWLIVIPAAGAIGLAVYFVASKCQGACGDAKKDDIINKSQQKSQQKGQEKVVTEIDIEELGDSEAFCRCWRSKKFPYCDGSHNNHNKETGDNVGPLCLSKKSGSS